MSDQVRQCYWREGVLVVETDSNRYELSSTTGVRALKENRLRQSDVAGLDAELPLFAPDDPRRMALIQEQISGLKD